jgi:DNA polymerase I
MQKRVLLVDATGLIFRAYYTIRGLSSPSGDPVNAVYGLVRILLKVFRETPSCASALVFDAGTDTFRKEQYSDYKANRSAPPDDMRPQFDFACDVARATGAPVYTIRGFEADDVIATLADKACAHNLRVSVLTGDRDMLQLLTEQVEVLMMKGAGEYRTYDPHLFEEEFGFPVTRYVDYKALMGDPSDNIPGVPGIGPKTAAQLIATHGKLETLYANIDMVKPDRIRLLLKEHRENVFTYRDLVTLRDDVEVDYDFHGRTMPDFAGAEFQAKLEEFGFNRVREDAAKLGDLQPAEQVIEDGEA